MNFWVIPTPSWDPFTKVTVGVSIPNSGGNFTLDKDMDLPEAKKFRDRLDHAIRVVEGEARP